VREASLNFIPPAGHRGHLPYWLGFYLQRRNCSLPVMDAVRRRIEGRQGHPHFLNSGWPLEIYRQAGKKKPLPIYFLVATFLCQPSRNVSWLDFCFARCSARGTGAQGWHHLGNVQHVKVLPDGSGAESWNR